jgi:hypothetical protein
MDDIQSRHKKELKALDGEKRSAIKKAKALKGKREKMLWRGELWEGCCCVDVCVCVSLSLSLAHDPYFTMGYLWMHQLFIYMYDPKKC